MKALKFLIILANIFNVLDIVTTLYAINYSGCVEGNILVRKLLYSNVYGYIAFKISVLLSLSIIALKTAYVVNRWSYSMYVLAFIIVCMILGLAVVNNIICIILY